MKTCRMLLLFLLLSGPQRTVRAEHGRDSFRSLNVNDGLTQNTVQAIMQDRFGFMRFGTKEWLNTDADACIEKPLSTKRLEAGPATLPASRKRIRRHFPGSPRSQPATPVQTGIDRDFMQTPDNCIGKQMREIGLSADDTAAARCMSSSNLPRKLKEISDARSREYPRFKRMKYAVATLQLLNYPIADIGMPAGFRPPAYFTACFKKQFGVPLSEFPEEGRGRCTLRTIIRT